jgi:DnaJ-class molecular chaperone
VCTLTDEENARELAEKKNVEMKTKVYVRELVSGNKENLAFRETISCHDCDEECEEPVTENWIKSGKCSEWRYEDCTSYDGSGIYICDHC